MKLNLTQKLAVAVIAAQGIFLGGWAYYEHGELQNGRAIVVKPVPVDPRDLMRGQYFTLAYDFSSVIRDKFNDDPQSAKVGAKIYAVLKKSDDLYALTGFYAQLPSYLQNDEVAVVGRIEKCYGEFMKSGMCRASYGIEKYFVTEGTKDPELPKTTVKLRVGQDNVPRIETMLVEGKPYP